MLQWEKEYGDEPADRNARIQFEKKNTQQNAHISDFLFLE